MSRQKRQDLGRHEQCRNPDFDTVSLGDGSMNSSESTNTPRFPPLNGMTDHRLATLGHGRGCVSDSHNLTLAMVLCCLCSSLHYEFDTKVMLTCSGINFIRTLRNSAAMASAFGSAMR